MGPNIVDIHGLAEILKAKYKTLQKRWKSLPHFYVGIGRNLKSARFDVGDVLEYLKNDGMERQAQGDVGSKVQARKKAVQKRGVPNTAGSSDVGRESKAGTAKPKAGDDPYNLFRGFGQ